MPEALPRPLRAAVRARSAAPAEPAAFVVPSPPSDRWSDDDDRAELRRIRREHRAALRELRHQDPSGWRAAP